MTSRRYSPSGVGSRIGHRGSLMGLRKYSQGSSAAIIDPGCSHFVAPALSAMRNSKSQVEDYRNRAEELRVLAESMRAGEPRETMLRIAGEYLHMAERLGNAAEE